MNGFDVASYKEIPILVDGELRVRHRLAKKVRAITSKYPINYSCVGNIHLIDLNVQAIKMLVPPTFTQCFIINRTNYSDLPRIRKRLAEKINNIILKQMIKHAEELDTWVEKSLTISEESLNRRITI